LNFVSGQNGLLTAGLMAWGLVLLKDRPVLAGAVLGLVFYKPQFFPLIPIALLAGGYRTSALSSLGSAATLALASLLVFGLDSWEGFVSVAMERSDLILSGDGALEKMQSATGALLLTGVPALPTQLIQGAVSLLSAAFVIWLWRRDDVAFEYKATGLILGILLATPYSYHYDLALLGLAGLWLAIRMHQDGWKTWESEALALIWLTPLLTLLTGVFLGFSIGFFVALLTLVILMRRTHVHGILSFAGGALTSLRTTQQV
jgi:hypothetical protein